jgi:hypothetical protein
MKKKKQKQKNDRLLPKQENDSKQQKVLHKLTHEFKVELLPFEVNPETGFFENVHLFSELLPTIEEFSHIFGDDSLPDVSNYNEWLSYQLGFVKEISPWIFIVMVDDKPQGLCWALNWGQNGARFHDVQISGLAKRKTPLSVTTKTIHALLQKIFKETDVYIVRSSFGINNRAASLAMIRAGLSNPEPQRAWMYKDGIEIAGIIRSITRPEWEAIDNVKG